MAHDEVTAAILVIGDEILSGRTRDTNMGYIGDYLTRIGIDVREARVVSDDEGVIAAALNALRERYDYVFTTGGIGPTHDDVTADAVARAFGVEISVNDAAIEMMKERYTEAELTPTRLRMARIPHGASLVRNRVSSAPGFHIGNVYVMAGVPKIMQAMLDEIAPTLKGGRPLVARTIVVNVKEGDVAEPLREIQARFPETLIGSYPFFEDVGRFGTRVVVRARDEALLAEAEAAVTEMARRLEANSKAS